MAAEVPGLHHDIAPETETENRRARRKRMAEKVRQRLKTSRGRSLEQVIEELKPYCEAGSHTSD